MMMKGGGSMVRTAMAARANHVRFNEGRDRSVTKKQICSSGAHIR
jgi:tRNA G18 (ribose-2'-O)-methylase SpoU